MALAAAKTWNPGDVLTAADLNTLNTNILNNPISLVSPTTGAINFNLLAHTNLLPSALSASSGSTGNVIAISTAGTAIWASAGGSYSVANLVGQNDATTPNTKFGWSYDLSVLRNTTDTTVLIDTTAGTITCDTAVAGPAANGRDQAAAFTASAWLHFYTIKGAGQVRASTVSFTAPPTGPALPTNYTHWAYMGAVFYNATPVLVRTRFRGSWMYYSDGQQTALSGGTASSETSVNLVTLISPNSLAWKLGGFVLSTAGTAANLTVRAISGQDISIYGGLGSAIRIPVREEFINSSQQFFYVFDGSVAPGFTANVLGFSVPNGGN